MNKNINKLILINVIILFCNISAFGQDFWIPINNGITDKNVNSLAINNENNLFACTNNGIFKSIEGRTNWISINNGLLHTWINSIAINSKGHIFAGSKFDGHLYVSTDGGDTWYLKNIGLDSGSVNCIGINKYDEIYIGIDNIIYKSKDNAATWTKIKIAFKNNIKKIVFNYLNDIFISFFNSSSVYRTQEDFSSLRIVVGEIGNTTSDLFVTRNNVIYIANQNGVSYSINNGESFISMKLSKSATAITINSNGYIFTETAGGLYFTSDNGVSWINTSNRFNSDVKSLLVDSEDNLCAAYAGDGVFISRIPTNKSIIKSSVDSIFFQSIQNSTLPTKKIAQITNDGVASMNWVLNNKQDWLKLNPNFGSNSGQVDVSITNTNLNSGFYSDSIYAIASNAINSPKIIKVFYMIFLSSPTLLQPSNNITNVLLSPTLTWKTQEDAVSYRIQIFSNLSSLILDTVLKSNNFYNQNLFKASVRYLWKVKSINAVGESPWSDLWNFTIMNVPDAPILNFPVNGAKDLLPGIIFKWGTPDLAISYGLQISRNQNFSPIDIDTSGINVASCEIKNLLPNTKYYWRVNASNLVGNGAWSNIWLFNTFITIPAIPILKSPPNTSNIKIDYRQPYVILIWENTNGAETYNLQVSDSISFRNNFIDQKGIKETYFTVNGIKNTQYFWRVKSVNGVGESNWSDIWSMNSQLLGVEPNEYIFPKNFSLLQNYPNPFNPSTRIEYSIPKNDFIELKIFDTYGRLVETLVNKKQQMGTYSLQWKPIDLPSGVYYYQLRTEKYNEVKKMVYIR